MEHKAFLFDYEGFRKTFAPRLREFLQNNDTDNLYLYIEERRPHLRDPYEGAPLDDDWYDALENGDIQELADFALTEFYDPLDDRGLMDEWLDIEDEEIQAAVLGTAFAAPNGTLFDPGRMGSYFQSPDDVRANLARLKQAGDDAPLAALQLLQAAADAGCGLYVTF